MIVIEKALFFGNTYLIYKDGNKIGELRKRTFFTGFMLYLNDEEWSIEPKSIWKSGLIVRKNDETLLESKSLFSFRTTWRIILKGKRLEWIRTGFFADTFVLRLEDSKKEVGNMNHSFGSSIWQLNFPPNVDDWFQVVLFCFCLTSKNAQSVAGIG